MWQPEKRTGPCAGKKRRKKRRKGGGGGAVLLDDSMSESDDDDHTAAAEGDSAADFEAGAVMALLREAAGVVRSPSDLFPFQFYSILFQFSSSFLELLGERRRHTDARRAGARRRSFRGGVWWE